MAIDMINLWALKQGVSPLLGGITIDNFHTPHYAAGYLAKLVEPRLAMATHVSFDRELIGEMLAGVRLHYKGLFAFGIDRTVVNVTKDRVWIREAALPETTNICRPSPDRMEEDLFGGPAPGKMTVTNPFLENQSQSIRDLEIDPALFTPEDQMRFWIRPAAPEFEMDPSGFMNPTQLEQ
jgi:ribonuclease Z